MKIAFSGPICSGKSTLSKYLQDEYNCKIISFAKPVKTYCTQIFDMKNKDRGLLQTFADKCKDINSLVWVNLAEKEIIQNINRNIIIDDLRYPNELDMLRRYNFIIIKLNINKDFQLKRIMQTYPQTFNDHIERLEHDSESYYEKFKCDYVINITEFNQSNIKNNIKDIVTKIIK
jgi:dephospho-CoA kinase